jgi:hypothetical protein
MTEVATVSNVDLEAFRGKLFVGAGPRTFDFVTAPFPQPGPIG